MPNIECEIRSFISEKQYIQLSKRLKKEAKFLGEDYQITYYYDLPVDLRIQINSSYSKIWLKSGVIHDEAREEVEIRGKRDDFEKFERLFAALGYKVKIKWFRKRLTFKWGDIEFALDDTKGYGRIIELETMTTKKKSAAAIKRLKEKITELGIDLTPKEVFDKRFKYYGEHWRKLTK